MLREQMQRLFASTFQCVFHDEEKGRHAGDGFLIAEKRTLWWDPGRETDVASRGYHVVLSERFLYRGIDMRAIDEFAVNGTARTVRAAARDVLKFAQTGFTQSYMFGRIIGAVAVVTYLLA